MVINTAETSSILPILEKLYIPPIDSHKGQNGKVLIVGGSNLFHSASIWAAEIASHFVDMVFYCSVEENNKIIHEAKTKFQGGIVVNRSDIEHYIHEADSILIGPGMVRNEGQKSNLKSQKLEDVLHLKDEGDVTYYLTKYLLKNFPKKKFVLDAGALQMMEKEWLEELEALPILTPHSREFSGLFGPGADPTECAKQYKSIILLKGFEDVITDGTERITIKGGNQGLTKGGTGDILAGLTTALYAKNDPMVAAALASYLLKKTADHLYMGKGYWYNIANIIEEIPETLNRLRGLNSI